MYGTITQCRFTRKISRTLLRNRPMMHILPFGLVICLFCGPIICKVPAKIELIAHDSSPVCLDKFIILGRNFESITFNVTGNDPNFLIDQFSGPTMFFTNGTYVCRLYIQGNICRNYTYHFFTCYCVVVSPTEHHFTFNSTSSTTLQSYTVYMHWPSNRVEGGITTKKNYTMKEVRDKRNCRVPTIEILNTAESTSCSHDFLVLGTDYQMVTFNISWSTEDYIVDRFGTPMVVNSLSGDIVCTLIGVDDECLLREFEDYVCLCEEITPDEYHLTLNFTPKHPGDSFSIRMRWRGQNGAKDIISKTYMLKEVKKTDCESWTVVLLNVGIGALILIAGGVFAYKFAPSMETASVAGSNVAGETTGMDADKMLETEKTKSTAVVQSDWDTTGDISLSDAKTIKVIGSPVDYNPSTEV